MEGGKREGAGGLAGREHMPANDSGVNMGHEFSAAVASQSDWHRAGAVIRCPRAVIPAT